MTQYHELPLVIAMQFDGSNGCEIVDWLGSCVSDLGDTLHLKTDKLDLYVKIGQWITRINEDSDQVFVYADEVFCAKYEEVK